MPRASTRLRLSRLFGRNPRHDKPHIVRRDGRWLATLPQPSLGSPYEAERTRERNTRAQAWVAARNSVRDIREILRRA